MYSHRVLGTDTMVFYSFTKSFTQRSLLLVGVATSSMTKLLAHKINLASFKRKCQILKKKKWQQNLRIPVQCP